MIEQIWGYKIQLLPVILTLLIYEIPAIIRKMKKLYYVPIYFSIYPLREINQNLSIYLAEDYFICTGCDLSDEEAEKLRKKIIYTSTISASLDAVVIPLLIGFITAFYLPTNVFTQFLVVLFIYKAVTITSSLKNFHYHSIASRRNIALLIMVCIVYIGVVIEMLRTSYSWTKPFVLVGNWAGLWLSLTAFIFGKVIAEGLVFAVVVAIFAKYIADREIRKKNVSKNFQSADQE
jgi:hypothetical protein